MHHIIVLATLWLRTSLDDLFYFPCFSLFVVCVKYNILPGSKASVSLIEFDNAPTSFVGIDIFDVLLLQYTQSASGQFWSVADLQYESIHSFLVQKMCWFFSTDPMEAFYMEFGSSLDKNVFVVFITGVDDVFRWILYCNNNNNYYYYDKNKNKEKLMSAGDHIMQ